MNDAWHEGSHTWGVILSPATFTLSLSLSLSFLSTILCCTWYLKRPHCREPYLSLFYDLPMFRLWGVLEFQYRNIKQCKLYVGNFVCLESSFLDFSSLETSYLKFSSIELSSLEFSYLLEASSYCINNHAIMQIESS